MDHHVHSAITNGLRLKGIDVLTAAEDNARHFDDAKLLDRAFELNRIMFTMDEDFLIEAAKRIKDKIEFTGIIYIHQDSILIGNCIRELEHVAYENSLSEMMNKVFYLSHSKIR